MHQRFHTVFALALIGTLVACSGSRPNIIPQTKEAATKDAQIVIHWNAPSPASKARKPAFVSPSAQSIAISVAPAGSSSPSAVVNTIANKPSTGSGTSTVSIDAPPGSDTFSFTAFDQQNAGGNKLGGGAVTQTISAGESNTVNVTLAGFAHGFTIASADSRIHAISGDTSHGLPVYGIAGMAQLTFTVSPLDVDGNVIVGSGAPAVTASSDTVSFQINAVSGQANTFTIQAVSAPPKATVPHLVLSTTGADGTTYSAEYALLEVPLLYVAAGSGSSAHIYAYDTEGTLYPLPGSFAGIAQPVGLAYDTTNHRLYVADAGTQSILAFDQSGTPVPSWTAPSVPGITAVAFSTHLQHVYATTTSGAGAVRVFDATGAELTASGSFAGLQAAPVGIAYAAGANLVAVVQSGAQGYVSQYHDDGSAADPSLSMPLTDMNDGSVFSPTGIGADNAFPGNFWITGIDHSDGNSYLSYLCSASCVPVQFVAPDNNVNIEGGCTKQGISNALSAVENPSNLNDDVYVVNGSGGLVGFTNQSYLPVGMPGYPLPISNVPGEAGKISTPTGVSNFTAAAFGDI